MNHVIEYITTDKVISAVIFLMAIFFQEAIKELVHSFKVGIGFKSNITLALFKDKKIDETIREFIAAHDHVDSAILAKITNGGGVPKEGSPLNSSITHPTEKKPEWPVAEVTPFFRNFIQKVYNEKRVVLPVQEIPNDDPAFSYIRSQKGHIQCIQMLLVKESRKCRYILSIRLLCTPEEFIADNRLREDIRALVNKLRKTID